MNVSILPLGIKDAKALAEQANNINIWNNVRDYFPHPYKLANAYSFIEMINNDNTDYVFSIYNAKTFVGVVGAHKLKDVYRTTAEVGYWIGESFWGNNYATQALTLLVQYIWAETNITRLEAGVFESNKASMRVLEKCNFIKEAVLKKRLIKNARIIDEHLYALVRS